MPRSRPIPARRRRGGRGAARGRSSLPRRETLVGLEKRHLGSAATSSPPRLLASARRSRRRSRRTARRRARPGSRRRSTSSSAAAAGERSGSSRCRARFGSARLQLVRVAAAVRDQEARRDDAGGGAVRDEEGSSRLRPPRVRQPLAPPEEAHEQPAGRGRGRRDDTRPRQARDPGDSDRERRDRPERRRGTCRGTGRSSSRAPSLRRSRSRPDSSDRPPRPLRATCAPRSPAIARPPAQLA